MLRNYIKTTVDVIDLEDILERLTDTYYVKLEALPEPIKLNDGEIINMRVYFTVPRKEHQDSSTYHIHFISDLAALFLADMIRAKKCTASRF